MWIKTIVSLHSILEKSLNFSGHSEYIAYKHKPKSTASTCLFLSDAWAQPSNCMNHLRESIHKFELNDWIWNYTYHKYLHSNDCLADRKTNVLIKACEPPANQGRCAVFQPTWNHISLMPRKSYANHMFAIKSGKIVETFSRITLNGNSFEFRCVIGVRDCVCVCLIVVRSSMIDCIQLHIWCVL